MNIYYHKESPRNKEYDKYPYFKHVIKPQDALVGYYAMKLDWKYVVLRKVLNCNSILNSKLVDAKSDRYPK